MPGGDDLVAVELGHAERELVEQLRRGVRLAVPLLVVGDREPEVGAEVDDVADGVDEVGGDRLRLAVRAGTGTRRRGRRGRPALTGA